MLKVHKKLLELFKRTIKILEENNIGWYAMGGMAIGALREGGFVPWDDDIDIIIKEEDKEKFDNINWEKSGLSLSDLNGKHSTPFPKVYDKNTKIKWRGTEGYLFIDIFIGYRKRKLSKFKKITMISLDYILHIKNYSYSQMKNEKNIFWFIPLFLIKMLPFRYKWLRNGYNKLIKKSKIIDRKKRHIYYGMDMSLKNIDLYYLIDKPTKEKFEDIYINVPNMFSETTKLAYGDIMIRPNPVPIKMDHGIEII